MYYGGLEFPTPLQQDCSVANTNFVVYRAELGLGSPPSK